MIARGLQNLSAIQLQINNINTIIEGNGSILSEENAEISPADEETDEYVIAWGLQTRSATPIQMDDTDYN